MRRLDPLTPDEARELDALERALAGDPVDPGLRAFEELVLDLRATAPEMTPAFAARLERDVADGFPQPVQRPPLLRRPRRWVLLPAAGVLAATLVAIVVVLGQRGDEPATFAVGSVPAQKTTARESAPAVATDGGGGALSPSAPARSAPATAAAPPPPATAAVTKSSAPRKLQRNAELSLEAPFDDVGKTSDAVIRTVDRFGGIVAASSIDDAGGAAEASFQLRIPTARLDEALAALSKLGHVADRTQSLQDITRSFTALQDRLSDARAERRGLLRALGSATTQARIDSLKARLRASRSTIARLNGDLAALRRQADLATVSLSITGVAGDGGAAGGHWTPADAAGDALHVLEVMAGVALIALAIAVPLALLGLAIALSARSLRRRERERGLGPA